ncbi:MAG: helix-turn-helix domain-containing protein, partial [Sphingobium yanoikuyae]
VNRVERAVALCEEGRITLQDFWPDKIAHAVETAAGDVGDMTLGEVRDRAESQYIASILQQSGGRIQDAASRLGVSRTTLWEKMRRYGLGSKEDES